jgi:membrane protease subunit (stomatin/prohibitin family)
MQLFDSGLSVTGFNIMSFNYPEEIQKMINKNASHSMVGDLGRYQQVEMTDGIASGKVKGGGTAADMAGMMMGMNVANQMMQNMNQQASPQSQPTNINPSTTNNTKPNFCPNCGQKSGDANFCPNCGQKLI